MVDFSFNNFIVIVRFRPLALALWGTPVTGRKTKFHKDCKENYHCTSIKNPATLQELNLKRNSACCGTQF